VNDIYQIKKKRMNNIIEIGLEKVQSLNIAICSLVRDCDKNLEKNIPIVNTLVSNFKDSQIIVFENDSADDTKAILEEWSNQSTNVFVECENFGARTIPEKSHVGENRYFSRYRISKMIEYRNRYLDKLESLNFVPDYVLIVDLDVSKIQLEGIFHSFGLHEKWDVITANGYSLSPRLKRRYHDSYALVEEGNEAIPQTENSLKSVSKRLGSLHENEAIIPVYSAYGGLAIYRYAAVRNLRYRLIENKDRRVEVRCEHFSLCHDIRKNGYDRIFINPAMLLKYQSISLSLFITALNEGIKAFIYRRLNP